jgi:L-fucose isomerase-like protein
MEMEYNGCHVGRRDFLKTSALAGVAATIQVTSLLGQDTGSGVKPSPGGRKRNLLFLTDSPAAHEKLVESIKAVKEFDFQVFPVKVNFQQPQEVVKAIQNEEADMLLICLPRVTTSSGNIPAAMGDVAIPVILLPVNFDLIMLEADMVAAFRARGTNAMLANSPAHAIALLKIAAAPRILEGKRAVIFGRPFDSNSVPARNLSEEYVYKHTGVRLQYRPISELKPLLESVSDASARKEMERWKREAVKVVEPSDQAILDASRLYLLLRSIVDKEGLSAISIDCLSFTFGANPILPYPCLSFTRLRDDGVSAPCEADVCGTLSSMLLQEISRKPSYFCNVSGANEEKSSVVLRHCVAPLKLMGREAPPLPYNLRDYHGMGRGVTPEVEFPVDVEVSTGGFSKDLKSFVLWPGRTIARVKDTDRPSFANAPPEMQKMRMFCSNHTEIKIKDISSFLQNIAGCHHVMVAGTYAKAVRDAMLRMNVNIVGPTDLAAPEKA